MEQLLFYLLRCYPSRYQQCFGASMQDTLDCCLKQKREAGGWKLALFSIQETCGLLNGIRREWWTQRQQGKQYLAPKPAFVLTADITEMQGQLQALLRGM